MFYMAKQMVKYINKYVGLKRRRYSSLMIVLFSIIDNLPLY